MTIKRVIWAEPGDVSALEVTSLGWSWGHRRISPPFQILPGFPQALFLLHSHVFSKAHLFSSLPGISTGCLSHPCHPCHFIKRSSVFKIMDCPINQLPGKCSMIQINKSLLKELTVIYLTPSVTNKLSKIQVWAISKVTAYLEWECANEQD